jgi:hypothetical protein
MGEEMMNYHSLKAYNDNAASITNKTEIASILIWKARGNGLTATDMARITGLNEHKSCSPALSRANKINHDIVYRKQEGKSHGRYYYRCFL